MTIGQGIIRGSTSPARATLYSGEVTGIASAGGPAVADILLPSPVQCTGLTRGMGYMLVDLKCERPQYLTSNTQIEITSGTGPDLYEWHFLGANDLPITTEYQTFYIPLWAFTELDSATPLNVNAIRYLRWYIFMGAGAPLTSVWWRNMRLEWHTPIQVWQFT